MNWPFESKNVKKMNEAAYNRVSNYMQCHVAEFMNGDEATHNRAQSIADAINAKDNSKCIVDSDRALVDDILLCLSSMGEHIKDGFPNALVACGYDPSIMFMVGDNAEDGQSKCVYIRLTILEWPK
jgi:hypothetical protein